LRVVASLLGVWVAWRWVGFFVGFVRVRRYEGPVRREARRAVVARGGWNVFFSVVVVYLWAAALRLQPGETLVGFLAAMMMCSLAIATAAWFMQPKDRTPETLEICRVRRSPRRPEAQPT
jgi:hypothetical protein